MTPELVPTSPFRLVVGEDIIVLPLPSYWSVVPVTESNQAVAIVDPDQDTGFRPSVVIQILPEGTTTIAERTVAMQADGITVIDGPVEGPGGSWHRIIGDWVLGRPIVQVEWITPLDSGRSICVTSSCGANQWRQLGACLVAAGEEIEIREAA